MQVSPLRIPVCSSLRLIHGYTPFYKYMMKKIVALAWLVFPCVLTAQTVRVEDAVRNFFQTYTVSGYRPRSAMGVDSVRVDENLHEVRVYSNESFSSQPFTPQNVKEIYASLQHSLPDPYNAYHLSIYSKGFLPIEELIPNILREGNEDQSRLWGNIDYKGLPWVRNASLPYQVTAGLQGRHLFIWPSHGRYFKNDSWQWQRPYLYCTTEDLFTQSFVLPYLFPMLEKAGAIIGTPRERDYQSHEAVVDNDSPGRQGNYIEAQAPEGQWTTSQKGEGFAMPDGLLNDTIHPFQSGTYRSLYAVSRRNKLGTATWTPQIPRMGKYAVYVSYASRPNSVPDAHYTVYHKGGRTSFLVNQQMGGGTWVYLGTFEFDEGSNRHGRVVLSNQSAYRGVVTADAVRFGGGTGQTERGKAGTSGLPRYLEAARYYAQWAGVPDSLVNTSNSENDYADDLRVRGNMLNWLAEGSPFLPGDGGRKVPFELSLAVHSDAGTRSDQSIYGSLSISTTQDDKGSSFFASGLSRQASSDFANLLIDNLRRDLSNEFSISWTRREHWDRNYAETRIPSLPSAILEMLSHQNYTDMAYGHDPLFKFALSRSVYRTILRYVSHEHGIAHPVTQPLPPSNFSALLSNDGTHVQLSWSATLDSLDASATPTGFILYTKTKDEAFDNGQAVGNVTQLTLPLIPNVPTAYQVSAVNAGGESFPSETLSVCPATKGKKRVLIVNGFDRLSGPARVERGDSLGFDLNEDLGVPYICTTAFAGRQYEFTNHHSEQNSSNELMGQEIAGNTFDFPVEHGEAIASSGKWSYSSVSVDAFLNPAFDCRDYDVIDYIGGLQADLPYNLRTFESIPALAREKLKRYLKGGGSLLISGSYLGSDNNKNREARHFIEDVLHFSYDGSARDFSSESINGMNLTFDIWRLPNSKHYAAQNADALWPEGDKAFSVFTYASGQSAGVAYNGKDYRTISLGFPFECIKDTKVRCQTMQAMLDFLTK